MYTRRWSDTGNYVNVRFLGIAYGKTPVKVAGVLRFKIQTPSSASGGGDI
jgi:hypothetical protein